MHDFIQVSEIQSVVGLVTVPQTKNFPIPVFIGALFRPQNLHVPFFPVRHAEFDSRIDTRHQKFIRGKLRDQRASVMVFGPRRLRSTVKLRKSK